MPGRRWQRVIVRQCRWCCIWRLAHLVAVGALLLRWRLVGVLVVGLLALAGGPLLLIPVPVLWRGLVPILWWRRSSVLLRWVLLLMLLAGRRLLILHNLGNAPHDGRCRSRIRTVQRASICNKPPFGGLGSAFCKMVPQSSVKHAG